MNESRRTSAGSETELRLLLRALTSRGIGSILEQIQEVMTTTVDLVAPDTVLVLAMVALVLGMVAAAQATAVVVTVVMIETKC
jgi:hypothetical protein